MEWYEILIKLVVVCALLLAGWRNPTTFALGFSWFLGEIYYSRTGDNLAISDYFVRDVAVVTVIYGKAIWKAGVRFYLTFKQQLRALVFDLTWCDRVVVGIFLLGVWPAYIFNIHPYYKWWMLYWLTIVQFLFSTIEPLFYRKHKGTRGGQSSGADILPFIRPGAEPVKVFDTLMDGGGGVRC